MKVRNVLSFYQTEERNSTIRGGCFFLILLINMVLGIWSVNYLLLTFLGKTIPLFWAFVIGIFSGELTIPVAIVVLILKYLIYL